MEAVLRLWSLNPMHGSATFVGSVLGAGGGV